MDNNNQAAIPQTPVPNTPPANPQPPVMPQPAPIPAPSNGSSKILVWFIIGLVLIVLLVGGIYLYLSRQQAITSTTQPDSATQTTPPATPATLEDELNSVNVDDTSNNDFAPVDQDLNQL